MSTGFEKLRTDTQLQNHWIRRFIAAVFDGIISGIAGWIFSLPFWVAGIPWGFAFFFIWGIIWFIYASLAESSLGGTVGKQLVNLKVRTVDGRIPTIDTAFIRNISKIFWLLYLLDVIAGLETTGDPTQKYTDRIAGTIIISVTPTVASVTTTPSFSPVP